MLTFVCFKWEKARRGFVLPAAITRYTAEHVNVLQSMIQRHYKLPHRFVCVTDQPRGIRAETIPLWDKYRHLGGCFNRLYVFSPAMLNILGPRFVCIDLDCVITQDITPLFDRPDDFVINSYNPLSSQRNPPDQHYNGGLFMMNAGARRQVWDSFDPERSVQLIQNNPKLCIGSDQAWIRLCLGKGEARWGNADGVYEKRQVRGKLPEDARIVLFAGARDPSLRKYPWIVEHWR